MYLWPLFYSTNLWFILTILVISLWSPFFSFFFPLYDWSSCHLFWSKAWKVCSLFGLGGLVSFSRPGKKKKRKPTSARAWQMVTVSWQIIYLNSQTFSFYLWLLHLSFRSPFINKTDRILTVPILKSKCIHLFFTHKWVSDKWTDSDKTPKPRLQSNIWTITKSLYMSFLPGFF